MPAKDYDLFEKKNGPGHYTIEGYDVRRRGTSLWVVKLGGVCVTRADSLTAARYWIALEKIK